MEKDQPHRPANAQLCRKTAKRGTLVSDERLFDADRPGRTGEDGTAVAV